MRWMISCCFVLLSAYVGATPIQWHTQYEEALALAEKGQKPMVLFFTGSDWCGWCQKLEKEALNTQAFADEVGDQFVFVKLDFPLYSAVPAATKQQNAELQKKYQIKGYPTLIILNNKQQQIGSTGYRPGGGADYGKYLKSFLKDYKSYQSKLEKIPSRSLSGKELHALLEQASSLHRHKDRQKIIEAGIQSDQKQYFLLEAYQDLVEEGQIHYPSARSIKKQLLAEDPENKTGLHFQVAVIDFETFLKEMEKENYDVEFAIAPLLSYIEKFGQQDLGNLWRLEMLISQVYLDHHRMQDALNHAKASMKAAPSAIQPQIDYAVQKIEAFLSS